MGCGVCPGDFLNKTPYKFEYEGMGSGDEAGLTGQGHSKMKDTELDLLKNAEFKEAFDEFDTVKKAGTNIVLDCLGMSSVCFLPQQKSGFTATSKCALPCLLWFRPSNSL